MKSLNTQSDERPLKEIKNQMNSLGASAIWLQMNKGGCTLNAKIILK